MNANNLKKHYNIPSVTEQQNQLTREQEEKLAQELAVLLNYVKENGGTYSCTKTWPARILWQPDVLEIVKELGYNVEFKTKTWTEGGGWFSDPETKTLESVVISNPMIAKNNEQALDAAAKHRIKSAMNTKFGQ